MESPDPSVPKPGKVQFRTVFLSDLHLGTKDAQARALLDVLRGIRCEKLVLNGDIIDLWSLQRRNHWAPAHTAVVRRILKMAERDGTQVVYLRGNHDDFIGRLLPLAGIPMPAGMKLPEQLEELQKLMKAGDARARSVYEAIGIAFGYALAHFAEYYRYECLLIMGRVTSGEGGSIIIDKARRVLQDEFPALRIDLVVPDEKDKRHGQAVAAASLPKTNR